MWTVGNVRVFTQTFSEENKQVIAELVPLRDGSIYQVFGWEGNKAKLTGYVVGVGDKNTLMGYTRTGTAINVNSPYGNLGNFLVKSCDVTLTPSIGQTLRPDLPCTAPVFAVSLELIKVE